MSRELILGMSVSLDGFVAGPNGEIDWVFRNSIPASALWLADQLEQIGLIAMGHRSYQGMADFWPTSPSPFAKSMNEKPKAVFSKSGTIAVPAMVPTMAALEAGNVSAEVVDSWRNPHVAGANLVDDINALKAMEGGPINALGGASFASSLIAADLVDVFRLAVYPVALGRGIPIFADLESPLDLKLVDLVKFDSGVMVKTFRPAGK